MGSRVVHPEKPEPPARPGPISEKPVLALSERATEEQLTFFEPGVKSLFLDQISRWG